MEVNIYGRNIKVTERLEEYVSDKVQKFAQLGDNVKDIDVTLADEAASPIEIRHKSFKGERLTPAEAVDRMELVGHDFYLYIDSETGAPAAAYRRKGWSYGIITLDNE